jgi:hypothetical protein
MLKLAAHVKKEAKAKWIIIDLVKDYFILHNTYKTFSKKMFDTFIVLFQSSCVSR